MIRDDISEYDKYRLIDNIMSNYDRLMDLNYIPPYYDVLVNKLMPILNLLPEIENIFIHKYRSPRRSYQVYIRNSRYPVVFNDYAESITGDHSCLGFSNTFEKSSRKSKEFRINSPTCGVSLVVDILYNLHELGHMIQYIHGEKCDDNLTNEKQAQIFSMLIYMTYFAHNTEEWGLNKLDCEYVNYINSILSKKMSKHSPEFIVDNLPLGNVQEISTHDYPKPFGYDFSYLDLVIDSVYGNHQFNNKCSLSHLAIQSVLKCYKPRDEITANGVVGLFGVSGMFAIDEINNQYPQMLSYGGLIFDYREFTSEIDIIPEMLEILFDIREAVSFRERIDPIISKVYQVCAYFEDANYEFDDETCDPKIISTMVAERVMNPNNNLDHGVFGREAVDALNLILNFDNNHNYDDKGFNIVRRAIQSGNFDSSGIRYLDDIATNMMLEIESVCNMKHS